MTKEEQKKYSADYCKAHKVEIAAKKRAYRESHKVEIAAYGRTWAKANPDKMAAASRAWLLANPDRVAARRQAYIAAHKAEQAAYRLSHRAESAAQAKAWALAHPDQRADNHARRRARECGAAVEKVSRAVVFERDAGRCHLCGKKVNPKKWHLDHITPLALGGEHSYKNVAVSCPKCNLTKGIKAGAQLRLL